MLAWLLVGQSQAAYAQGDADRPWNVLLLTVDCLRPDHLSVYGYERDTSPRLAAFAKDALVFRNAFATSAWTSPGILSLLTGYYPPVHAQNGRHSYYDAEMASPLRVLAEEGYTVFGRYINGPTLSNLGFHDRFDPDIKKGLLPLEGFMERREPNGKPFFAWAHIKETHLPYAPSEANAMRWIDTSRSSEGVEAVRNWRVVLRPENVEAPFDHPGKVTFVEEDIPVVRALYDGMVAEVDERLGKLFDRMREKGLLERTLVIISADHGEELLEHGWVGHASTSYDGRLYDEVTRIPLIIRLPDGSKSGDFDALVQGVDVMPTIFELLGIKQNRVSPAMQGRSLLPLVEGEETALREHAFMQTTMKGWTTPRDEMRIRLTAVRSLTHKLIRIPDGEGYRFEGYDLRDDPGEQNDIYETRKADFAGLERALQDWIDGNRRTAASLVQEAAARQSKTLDAQLVQNDLLEAARTWNNIEVMHRTHGLELEPFYEQEPYASTWASLRRDAARRLAAALACQAEGGRLQAESTQADGWVCAE